MQFAENSNLSRYDWIPGIVGPWLASSPTKEVLDILKRLNVALAQKAIEHRDPTTGGLSCGLVVRKLC